LIVHAKPLEAIIRKNEHDKHTWTEPKVMVRLQEMKVVNADDVLACVALELGPESVVTALAHQISTQATAKWACKAASGIVNAMLDAIPNKISHATELLYRKSFAVPDNF
jgi:hypothetical protein